jgi:peptidoglycan/xylan/chitin deacetylase (PgdA/CDA1 family)
LSKENKWVYKPKIFNRMKFWMVSMVIIGFTIHVHAQKPAEVAARITTWYQNKPGAVSVTFDDASFTQYTAAYPILEKLGIKATFGIVGEWVSDEPMFSSEPGSFEIKKMGWPQLLELSEHGHELSAHGFHHEQYNKLLPVKELGAEMVQIKTLIETNTPSVVYTMNYPYSYASGNIPLAAKEAGYLFGRTGLDTVNPASPADMYLLASRAILSESLPDSTGFRQWLSDAKKNWLILMYHHFFDKDSKEAGIIRSHDVLHSYSVYPELFEQQMTELVAADYWVAPVSAVGKYITERDGTEVKVIKSKKVIYIHTFTNLNKNIYNQPLTLEVTVPWKRVGIKGSRNDGIVEVTNYTVYIDILPEREIIITKE